jgi:thiol-disulfide isomerase/thioredoxin
MKRLLTACLASLALSFTASAVPPRLPVEPLQPTLAGAGEWINSAPLSFAQLRGKVVLVDFWTYSCINCQRTLPWLRAWAQKYGNQGLVVIGVHAPEFGFERDVHRVRKAAKDGQLDYPIVLDNDFAIWRAFRNQAWPALYFVDAQGRVRHHQFGEGDYDRAEQVIRELLTEAGRAPDAGMAQVTPAGVGLAPDLANVRSPETYLGYEHGAGRGILPDRIKRYAGGAPRLNDWTLSGDWIVRSEFAESTGDNGAVTMRFHARDLHLVLGPAADGRPLPFRVTIDGQPPGADRGVDVDADGRGVIDGERLYQLVRQRGPVRERLFEIRFSAPGARAFAFTFG